MKTKINTLLKAVLSLLVTFGFTHSTAAQDRIVFYTKVVATNFSNKTHTESYTTNRQIMTMNVDGSNVRQLTTGTADSSFPAWRPGRTHILFHRAGAIHVMDANGEGMFAVASALNNGADWSPDGQMICYVAHPAPGPLSLWIVSVDPSAKGNRKVGTPILVGQGDFYGPVWSPDGTRIAFSDQNTGLIPLGPRIRVLELATRNVSTLDMSGSLLPSWSPDGSLIAFSGNTAIGSSQLWIMNADFSGLTQVTHYNNSVLWPTWSPDGSQMAFRIGTGQNDDASIYKLTLATGELTLLRQYADHPDWNP